MGKIRVRLIRVAVEVGGEMTKPVECDLRAEIDEATGIATDRPY
jgi:hypothetical protein